jgi:hypothetical protein
MALDGVQWSAVTDVGSVSSHALDVHITRCTNLGRSDC